MTFPNGNTKSTVDDLMNNLFNDDIWLRPKLVAWNMDFVTQTWKTTETKVPSKCTSCIHSVRTSVDEILVFLFTDKNFQYGISERDWIICSYWYPEFNKLTEIDLKKGLLKIGLSDFFHLPVKARYDQWKWVDCPMDK